jgi:hypothetical protein
VVDRLEALRASLMALGDDVQERHFGFISRSSKSRISRAWNLGQRQPKSSCLSKLILSAFSLGPASAEIPRILEITLSKPEDLERVMPLIKRSYEVS